MQKSIYYYIGFIIYPGIIYFLSSLARKSGLEYLVTPAALVFVLFPLLLVYGLMRLVVVRSISLSQKIPFTQYFRAAFIGPFFSLATIYATFFVQEYILDTYTCNGCYVPIELVLLYFLAWIGGISVVVALTVKLCADYYISRRLK